MIGPCLKNIISYYILSYKAKSQRRCDVVNYPTNSTHTPLTIFSLNEVTESQLSTWGVGLRRAERSDRDVDDDEGELGDGSFLDSLLTPRK